MCGFIEEWQHLIGINENVILFCRKMFQNIMGIDDLIAVFTPPSERPSHTETS